MSSSLHIVPVVFYSDNNGAAHYVVTMQSLFMNKLPSTNYDIYFFHSSDLSVEHKSVMTKVVEAHSGSMIHFCDMGDAYKKVDEVWWSTAAFYRLKIPSIIPSQYKRVISLDYDTIVRHDLYEMFTLDMQGKSLAGVLDYSRVFFNGSDLKNELKLSDPSKYINSGVLLWNLEKIREKQNIQEYLDRLAERNFKFVDQDVLNVAFCNDICLIHPKYNNMNYMAQSVYKLRHAQECYGKGTLEEACENASIYHYTNIGKPWSTNYSFFDVYKGLRSPYMKKRFDEWWYYALRSPYRDIFLPIKRKQFFLSFVYLLRWCLVPVIIFFRVKPFLKRILKHKGTLQN